MKEIPLAEFLRFVHFESLHMAEREQERIHTPKKFPTNSDKSVFNLRWESGGVAQKYYQRSRTYGKPDTTPSRTQSFQHPRRPWKPSENNERSIHPPNQAPKSIGYYYLDAYPSMPVGEPPITKTRVKQSEKSPEKSPFKVEHHYIASPKEAQKLIDNLRRKGYTEIGLYTPASSIDHKKK